MNRAEATGSDYINVDQIREKGGTARLVIEDVVQEQFKNKDDGYVSTKLVIKFKNTTKKLTLGKNKANEVFDVLGEDTDDWVGQRIELYLGKTDYMGKRVDCVKLRLPVGKTTSEARPAPAPARPVEPAPVQENEDAEPVDGDDDQPF